MQALTTPIAVLEVNGELLHLGQVTHRIGPMTLRENMDIVKNMDFLVLPATKDPITLGYPWLREHKLVIGETYCLVSPRFSQMLGFPM